MTVSLKDIRPVVSRDTIVFEDSAPIEPAKLDFDEQLIPLDENLPKAVPGARSFGTDVPETRFAGVGGIGEAFGASFKALESELATGALDMSSFERITDPLRTALQTEPLKGTPAQQVAQIARNVSKEAVQFSVLAPADIAATTLEEGPFKTAEGIAAFFNQSVADLVQASGVALPLDAIIDGPEEALEKRNLAIERVNQNLLGTTIGVVGLKGVLGKGASAIEGRVKQLAREVPKEIKKLEKIEGREIALERRTVPAAEGGVPVARTQIINETVSKIEPTVEAPATPPSLPTPIIQPIETTLRPARVGGVPVGIRVPKGETVTIPKTSVESAFRFGPEIRTPPPEVFAPTPKKVNFVPARSHLPQDSFKGTELLPRDRNVINAYEKMQQDQINWGKLTPRKVWQTTKRKLIDVSGNVKTELKKAGDPGRRVVMEFERVAGASSKAELVYREAEGNIFQGLTRNEENLLGLKLLGDRVIEIDTFKDSQGLKRGKSPSGLHKEDYQSLFVKNSGSATWDRVLQAQTKYNEAMQGQLRELFDNGLITEESFQNLGQFTDYNPRIFIDKLDPEIGQIRNNSGQKVTVRDSGVQELKEGSEGTLITDPRILLSQVISRAQGRVFRNNANKSLLDLARQNPDNGVVELAGEGKVPVGKVEVSAIENGVQQRMVMPSEFGKEWIINNPEISRSLAATLNIGFGGFILRPFATGALNPFFAFTNLPRDIALSWMSTTQYSSFLPKATGQYLRDMGTVMPDVLLRKGRYKDYINEGGGMDFMTHQGSAASPLKSTKPLSRPMAALKAAGEYTGLTSEIAVRLALRERGIRNGLTSRDASMVARNYLDFSQGGSMAKAVDAGIPYTNAAIQASRSIVRGATENPGTFSVKAAQIAGLSTALYLANRSQNPKAWNAVSDDDKTNHWIFTTPWRRKDSKGRTQYAYFRVPKDQGQQVFAAVADDMATRYFEGKQPRLKTMEAVKNFIPGLGRVPVPPSVSAGLAYYLNKDLWSRQDLWRGPRVSPLNENDPTAIFGDPAHPAFVALTEKFNDISGIEVSPTRLQGALPSLATRRNVYHDLVGGAWNMFSGEVSDKENESMVEQIQRQPGVRRHMRWATEGAGEREEVNRLTIEENERSLTQLTELNQILQRPNETISDVMQEGFRFIANQPEPDQQRLARRALDQVASTGVDDDLISLERLDPRPRALKIINLLSTKDKLEQAVFLTRLSEGDLLTEKTKDWLIELKKPIRLEDIRPIE